MKKYIKPQIEVSNIEVESLLNGTSNFSTSLQDGPTINKQKDILSKEYSFEDDWGYEE